MPILEDEVTKNLDKIKQNFQEESNFEQEFEKMLNRGGTDKPLLVGKTPNSLAICGANDKEDLVISKRAIDKCMRPELRDESGRLVGKTGHGLSKEELLLALKQIKSPAMVLAGSVDNSLVAVTDLTNIKGGQIIVAIHIGEGSTFSAVNKITSLYGKENFMNYLYKQLKNGKVIAVNKEKADKMLRSIRNWYPKENTSFISFDNSIAYTTKNVKQNVDIFSLLDEQRYIESAKELTDNPLLSIKDKLDAIDKLKDNYLKNAEMSVEDDFNSIDGIINNGKKDNVVQNSEKIGTAVISKKALKARADKLKQNPPKKEKEHHKREEQSL